MTFESRSFAVLDSTFRAFFFRPCVDFFDGRLFWISCFDVSALVTFGFATRRLIAAWCCFRPDLYSSLVPSLINLRYFGRNDSVYAVVLPAGMTKGKFSALLV